MTTAPLLLELECEPSVEEREKLIRAVRDGLRSRPRSLEPWMFYDELGSRLFERITTLPEYYLTRTERSLLESHAEAIVDSVCDGSQSLRVVELGAGTASKTCLLLAAAAHKNIDVVYVPLDVSADALDMAIENIRKVVPTVLVDPLVVNYVDNPPQLKAFNGVTLALYLGTSIGNFVPLEAQRILRNLASQLQSKDAFLLGTDLVKDEETLVAAYQDTDGVTAAFNLNILHRLNRELGADFDLTRFRHYARWNPTESRVEMHLQSTQCQHVRVPASGLEFDLRAGETIHTENSYKFTNETLHALLSGSGFRLEAYWKDSRNRYAISLSGICDLNSDIIFTNRPANHERRGWSKKGTKGCE